MLQKIGMRESVVISQREMQTALSETQLLIKWIDRGIQAM